jgi:iron(III) transport system permease protein
MLIDAMHRTSQVDPPVPLGPIPVRGRWSRLAPRLNFFGICSVCIMAMLAFLAVYPLGRIVVRLFYDDGRLSLAPLARAFEQPLLGVTVSTVIVVGTSATLALLIGSLLAWINERTDASFGAASEVLPLIPFLMPPIAAAVGWVLLFSPGAGLVNVAIRSISDSVGLHLARGPFDVYSWYGLILAYTVFQVPYVFLVVSAGLRNIDPALEHQSRVCGAGLFRTTFKVTLPAVAPSLGAAAMLAIWFGFALFSIPSVIAPNAGIDVLSLKLVTYLRNDYPPQLEKALGLGLIIVVFVGGAWLWQGRILRAGRHATISGGQGTSKTNLGRLRWPARLLFLGYVFISSILPALGLTLVALNGYWGRMQWSKLRLDAFREVIFNNERMQQSIINSFGLGLIGGVIAVGAAAVLTLYIQRSSGKVLPKIADGLIRLPAVISGFIIALGFVIAFSGPPFNLQTTLTILLLAYIVVYLPQALVATDAAASQIGRDLADASAISGAKMGRTFRRIQLPLMAPALVSAWALMYVRIMGELTVSPILSGTRNPVIGFNILEALNNGSYARLAALSVMLTMISMVVLVTVFGGVRWLTRRGVPLSTTSQGAKRA